MGACPERVVELEWANYAATRTLAQVTPDLEVVLRDDVILTSSATFATYDANHACLLRTTAGRADDLIAEVTAFFWTKGLPVAIYVSPACTPEDLSERLLERRFNEQPEEEAWLVLEDLPEVDIPSPFPGVRARPITRGEAIVFAQVFLTAFSLPSDFAPVMAQLLQPGVELPNVRHYLALNEEQPIGTCSLLCHDNIGVLGSAGVLANHRGSGAATTLMARAAKDALALGVDTLMLQTTADTALERLLRISGFKRAFKRSCYVSSIE
jgi:GNAT superfamily N-acetyltransferase